ncbi:MAG: hypothetical protein LN568_00100 [Rickettsia endosymbiont of Pseudomimeciton antennatum]|nr:hypothetical protein [Rickettsia endosymbiont of Pseudomimeciton antennatum]
MKILIVILFLLFSFPIHAKHIYNKEEWLLKGNPLKVPSEFQNGTATVDDILNWSLSLQKKEYGEPISLRKFPLDEDRNTEIVLVEVGTGSQNSLYFIFMKREIMEWTYPIYRMRSKC